jgi:hypothetical protein
MSSLLIRLLDTIEPPEQLRIEDGSPFIVAITDTTVAMILLGILEEFEKLGYITGNGLNSRSNVQGV